MSFRLCVMCILREAALLACLCFFRVEMQLAIIGKEQERWTSSGSRIDTRTYLQQTIVNTG